MTGVATAQPVLFTGDAEADFGPDAVVIQDPGAIDVGVPLAFPVGTVSGNDIKDLRLSYDAVADVMYVGFNMYGIATDVDSQDGPDATGPILAGLGGVDVPRVGGTEAFALLVDVDEDGLIDLIVGVSGMTDIDGFTAAAFAGSPFAPGFAFGAPLPPHTGAVAGAPSALLPDIEFTVPGWSALPTSSGGDLSAQFSITAFVGSFSDAGIGEDFTPGVNQFAPVCFPQPETCNELDDDCDGEIDEGFDAGVICNVGVGACAAVGVRVCLPDGSVECSATQGDPRPEACNAVDDDCDGTIDEDIGGGACTSDLPGVCADGHVTCEAGQLGCTPNTPPGPETCDNTDDDCDGSTDEGFVVGQACEVGVGTCRVGGVTLCGPDGGVRCSGTPNSPNPETCDALDNDCDGRTDEGYNLGDACAAGEGACQVDGVIACDGTGGSACGAIPGEPVAEACNGLDDDCDGSADEGTGGDACDTGTPGVCAGGTNACVNGALACQGENQPGAELCDTVDNDCDGQTDEGFGVGTPCQDGVGACQANGVVTCDGNGAATCSATQGDPVAEVCDGVDNDCDGQTDEGLGLGDACDVGVGACAASGERVCDGAGGVTCDAQPGQGGVEGCNDLDDDCDGAVDEGLGLGEVCSAGVGACQASGITVCGEGAVVCDAQPGQPEDEVCDGNDNDCDGSLDEGLGLGEACEAGVGECNANGVNVCDGLGGVTCNATSESPKPEVCNGLDDDCDGSADEKYGVGEACSAGVGACLVNGEIACDGTGGSACNVEAGEGNAEACDGVDNDCDGTTDEGTGGGDCATGVPGECATGESVCVNGALVCEQRVQPAPETCNTTDDDCDGSVDEGFGVGELCSDGVGACASNGVTVCDAQGGAECSATQGDPQPETCNAADDDCDGTTDEGTGGDACESGQPGACGPGTTVCANGAISCEPGNQPGVEVCNNADDDCDGELDEGTGAGAPCQVGVGQCMGNGVNICTADGGVECSATQGDPRPETCDGVDDDCDGQIDEGLGLGDACNVGQGACGTAGELVCDGDGGVTCNAQPGAPGDEVCDNADNDCDGNIDEGLGLGDVCSVGVGVCQSSGVQTCDGNGGVACDAQPGQPEAEVCDANDNDCDGRVDEDLGLGDACDAGVGACNVVGENVCDGLGGVTCNANPLAPGDEVCDSADNDCDGNIDEGTGVGEACNVGVGACAGNGVNVCDANGGVECSATQGDPQPETCNAADDDCDGAVDEGTGGDACDSGEPGACGPGTTACVNGAPVCQAGQPGAEVCDSADNDCDGNIDEGTGAGEACQVGVGACAGNGVNVCDANGGVECSATQGDPQPETCNAADDDCDGTVDEGTGGDACDSGEPGACGPGTTACVNGAISCEPGNQPGAEVCDSADNDCDGNIDEGTGAGEACQVGVGACAGNGVNVCDANGGVECSATQGDPQPETCNAADDDCDGTVDEGTGGDACDSGEPGACGPGTTACVNGAISCEPGNQPGVETCDGTDQDCDGNTDEGLGLGDACSAGVGACADDGENVCDGNGGVTCNANPGQPVAETCNGLDDDCDGTVDEGTSGEACDSGLAGACGPGTIACVNGAPVCEPGVEPGVETCNASDDDCDGRIDEGFNVGGDCEAGVGACNDGGTIECDGNGGVTCIGNPYPPSDEVCNGIDDDCDGSTDEGLGLGERCNAGVGACAVDGELACGRNGAVVCDAEPGQPVDEICDGLDNDCDGTLDEGTGGDECDSGRPGACGPGTTICVTGQVVCDPTNEPGAETCDALDNDCDGSTDEGFGVGDACDEGQGACADSGRVVCDGEGGATCDATPAQPGVETCNAADDDCDGRVDEDFNVGDACQHGQGACAGPGQIICRDGAAVCDAEGGDPAMEICDGIDNDCDGEVDENSPARQFAADEYAANGHAVWLPNFYGDGAVTRLHFNDDAVFTMRRDGTASVTGNATVHDGGVPGEIWYVDVDLALRGRGPDFGGPKIERPAAQPPAITDEWMYYDIVAGAVSRGDQIADLTQRPVDGRFPFQFGERANGKNNNLGAAVWFDWVLFDGGERVRSGHGDINVNLDPLQVCEEICDAEVGELPETCNDSDDDCDGIVDEGFDTGSACIVGEGECAAEGERACGIDGDVICEAVPGVPQDEICDGLDNDCDGRIDEGFGLGEGCTDGVGACRVDGEVVCGADGNATCNAEAGDPADEACDAVDNDCDGTTDEGLGLGDECAVGEGACGATGEKVCGDDGAVVCDAQPGEPVDEICDDNDNDCDGTADEGLGLGEACNVGVGACANDGLTGCDENGGVTCDAVPGQPVDEICDGIDNDCDGRTDEGLGLGDACNVGVGACGNDGEQVCDGNGGVTCDAEPGAPVAETCNDADDDCDGRTDEGLGLGERCSEGVGGCMVDGVNTCGDDGAVICSATPTDPVAEACDAIDNDCDGRTDEGLGLGDACNAGEGACAAEGEQVCDGNGGVTCDAEPAAPVDEICDAADNDCDGRTDEGLGLGDDCSAGEGACAAEGHLVCGEDGQVTCDAAPVEPMAELCDGLDNDCDGEIDEAGPRQVYAASEFLNGHAFWLPNLYQAGKLVRMRLRDGAEMVIADGVARLTGTAYIYNNSNGPGAIGEEWDVNIAFAFRGVGDAFGGPKVEGPEQTPEITATWTYYDMIPGDAVIRRGNTELRLTQMPADGRFPFQVGQWANVQTNSFGGASWFFWNKFVDGVEVSNGRGDVNIDLLALDACVEVCDPAAGEPLPETCDGRDNDCDGIADEGFDLGDVCVTGEGACGAVGETVCNDAGDGVMCDAEPGQPADEICDDVDNDCDGSADEGLGLGERCEDGEGACAASGETVCGENGDVICDAQPGQPQDETCDALDNDCDAASDEGLGLGEPCTVGQGACAANGENICDGNGGVTCSADPIEPGVETCDGVDNDCDGRVDEGFGLGDACNAGQGACAAVGEVVCDGNGGATCDAEPAQPGAELCDDMDNDCDGFTDEGFGVGERCAAGQGVCRNIGERVCDANGGVLCDAVAGDPSDELCDEEDNDCDGLIDEDFDLEGDCSVGLGECQRDGQRICGEDDVVAGLGGNLVLNGSFEQPELNRDWAVFQEIQGWTTIAGNGIEVQRINDAATGNQYVELDSHPTPGGGCMMQQIPVDIGGIYRLSVSHSARPNVGDNRVALYWDGVEVAELDADGRGLNNTVWTRHSYDVTGNNNSATLVICDVTNDRDTLGGFVDDVTLEMVEGIMCDADPGEPEDERCDALDNDCDGYIDEDLGIGDECQVGVGACANIGARQCDENGDVICAGRAGEPVDEACDNVDNDCDGLVDEGACDEEPPCEGEAPGTRVYQVTAWDADQYGLYLPNWNEQGHRTDMLFRDGATFTVRADGTATLTGTAFVNSLGGGAGQLGEEWAVAMNFELRGTGAEFGGPYRERPEVQPAEVTDLWTYFNLTGGTFTRGDIVATLSQYPENGRFPFQMGQWANGRSDSFGASNWYRWTRNNADGSASSSIGDMNINLDEICVTPEPEDCSECDGKVTRMTLRNDGPAGRVVVEQRREGVIFDRRVAADESFELVGVDGRGTLGTEVNVSVDGGDAVRIHTSCSVPIGPGSVFGDFVVVEAYSRNGGLICGEEPPACEPQDEICNDADDDCDGEIDEGLDCVGAPVCPQVAVIDYETDAEGNAIDAGRDLSDAYSAFGVHLATYNRGGNADGLGIAFDTANPTGGDPDLGTPNRDFGGPGRGNGGERGREGENANALGNVLVRAENTVDNNNDGHVDVPDDHGQGARFDYTFDNTVCVYGVDLLDVEDNERGASFEFFDANGALIQTVRAGGLGNNSFEHVDLDVCGVQTMRTKLIGSGAIDNIEFCIDPNAEPPICEAGAAFAVDEYSANGHAFVFPRFDGNNRTVKMHLRDDARFIIRGDEAVLSGTAFRTDNGDEYTVDVRFEYRGQGAEFGGPKIERPQWQTDDVTALWRYFDMTEATLMHDGVDVVTLTQMPADGRYPLQVGMAANGKNEGLGMSSWYTWVRENPRCRYNGTGDINVNLQDACE